MAVAETNIVNTIMKDVSPAGVRLFRNVRGHFYTLDSVKALIVAIKSFIPARINQALQNLRQLKAGLQVPGGSDLVGFTPIVITPAMVGMTVAVFTALEVKTDTGKPSPEQLHFCDVVQKSGGFAGVVRNSEEAQKIVKIIC